MRPVMGCALRLAARSSAASHTMKPVTFEQLGVLGAPARGQSDLCDKHTDYPECT
jgi:hypothetical protein